MTWLESIRASIATSYRDYADKLDDDDSTISDVVLLYAWSSVEERYATNEMDAYLPTHVSIGNDSGDNEFLLRRDGSAAVYQCDAGAFGATEPEIVHPDVGEWIAAGCPLPDDEDIEPLLPFNAPIWLIHLPDDGLKAMFELRKILGQSWPSSTLRSMMEELPTLLVEDGQPLRTSGMLESKQALLACLACGSSPAALTPLQSNSEQAGGD